MTTFHLSYQFIVDLINFEIGNNEPEQLAAHYAVDVAREKGCICEHEIYRELEIIRIHGAFFDLAIAKKRAVKMISCQSELSKVNLKDGR